MLTPTAERLVLIGVCGFFVGCFFQTVLLSCIELIRHRLSKHGSSNNGVDHGHILQSNDTRHAV